MSFIDNFSTHRRYVCARVGKLIHCSLRPSLPHKSDHNHSWFLFVKKKKKETTEGLLSYSCTPHRVLFFFFQKCRMLRRASQAGGCMCYTTFPCVCTRTTTITAATTQTRSFFPPGTPGKDFLRQLTTLSEPTNAFSSFDKFRPPAPPSASDAQPFGSLNRTNRLRRYVNVNIAAAATTTTTTTAGSEGAGDTNSLFSNRSHNNETQTVDVTSHSNDSAASAAPSSSAVSSSLPPSPQMDLSKLVRRHTSSSAADAAAAPATTTTTTTNVPSSDTAVRRTTALTGANSAADARSSEAASSFAAASTTSAHSTHATVARAQATIAAAQHRKEAAQQVQQRQRLEAEVKQQARHAAALHASHREHKEDKHTQGRQHVQVYKEHCTIGWSLEEFYRVVADVEHYTEFLPWCAGSAVHMTRRVRVPRGRRLLPGNLPQANSAAAATAAPATAAATATASSAAFNSSTGFRGKGTASSTPSADVIAAAEAELVDAIEMTATLTVGFLFLKEQYTSRVTMYPGNKIVASLYDDEAAEASAAGSTHHDHQDSFVVSFFKKAASTAGAAAKRSILKHLLCEWEFCPVPGKPNMVEVVFSVSFEFKNPMHSHMIMSNVVTLMTRSFERRCESLYGPPSVSKESLPLFH